MTSTPNLILVNGDDVDVDDDNDDREDDDDDRNDDDNHDKFCYYNDCHGLCKCYNDHIQVMFACFH